MIKKYLTRILSIALIVLLSMVVGLGLLYKESVRENGSLTEKLTSLETSYQTCQMEVGRATADMEDMAESFANIHTEYGKIKSSFDGIQKQLRNKQCKGTVHEENIDNDVAADISHTIGLLREASCLSTKDCERP